MTAAVVVWVGAYFVLMLALLAGVHRLPRSRRLTDPECVSVSVIVSARNEERDLPACLASLAALDYPHGQLQLVLVNDRSDDGTGALIDAFAARNRHAVALHTDGTADSGLDAKARGLAYGFTRATGEWVLITDADAEVPRGWIRHMLGSVTADVGLVGGGVVVRAAGWIGVIERVSWAFVQLFSSGAAGLGFPFIGVGPNIAIRRSVYVAAGGLECAQFRVAEDLALTRMVRRAGLRIAAHMDAETTAVLAPVPSLAHLLSQQRRWLGGGVEQGPAYRTGLLVSFGWGFGVAAFFAAGWLVAPVAWLWVTVARLAIDGAGLALQQKRMELTGHIRYLPALELYVAFVFVFLPISFLFSRRIVWRGSGYAVRYISIALLALAALPGALESQAPGQAGASSPSSVVRLSMQQHGREVVLELGPIDLPAVDAHARHGSDGQHAGEVEPPPLWVTIPADGWFHGYTVDLVDAAGHPVPQRVLHHINVIATRQRELFSPIMLRLAAAGPETQSIALPRVIGYRAVRGDSLLVRAMFHNQATQAYRGVRVRVRFPFTPATAWIGALRIQPFYLDVTEPHRSHVFDLPPGRTEKYWEAKPAVSGRILGFSGHVHRYATVLTFEDRTARKILWQVRPDTNARGEPVAIPIQRFLARLGLKLEPTHVYRLSVVYENPTGATIRDGGMGALGGVVMVARRARWPAIDPNDPVYREDVRGMSTP